jgi:acyl phosphate:glycerol-3-phosphate acyltransferase
MQILFDIVAVVIGYLLGSIPFGLLIVKLKTGKDIREVESGRTGGTNAMRAAGFGAGLLTAIMDALKGIVAVLVAQALTGNHLIHVFAAASAIIGHNYSIFLTDRDENGRLRLRGGAGAMPAIGGAIGFWGWSFPIIVGLGALVFFTVGIASLATITVGMSIIILFTIRASMGLMPWVDVLYGVIAEVLLIWALRTNIRKLFTGNERIIKYSLNGWLRSRKNRVKLTKQ